MAHVFNPTTLEVEAGGYLVSLNPAWSTEPVLETGDLLSAGQAWQAPQRAVEQAPGSQGYTENLPQPGVVAHISEAEAGGSLEV